MTEKQRRTPAVTGTSGFCQPPPTYCPFVVDSSGGKGFNCGGAFQEIGREGGGGDDGTRLKGLESISLGLFLNGFNVIDLNC